MTLDEVTKGRLLFASVVGYFVFGEVVDRYTWLGAAILIGATFYIARREAAMAKERVPDASIDSP